MISLLSLVVISCEVTESFNEAPVIKSIEMNATEAGDGLIYTSEEVTLTCTAVDPEGDLLSYTWSIEDNAGQLAGENGVSVTWIAPYNAGTYVAKCTVKDPDGATTVEHYNLHVVKYAFVTGISVNGGNDVNPNSTITLDCNISASSVEEDFRFTWMLNDSTQIGLGKMIQWRTPAEEGDYEIACVVEKVAGGEQVTEEVTVCSYFDIFGTSILVNYGLAVYPEETINLECTVYAKEDYDFTWNLVQGTVISPLGMGSSITWRTPEEEGNYIVSCTVKRASDGQESTAYASIFSYHPLEETFKMHGFIKDIHTNELLPDVTLTWYENGTSNSVVTDANGFYFIPEIIEGESHEMIFSCPGYATATYHLGEIYDEDIEKNFNMYELNAAFEGAVYFEQHDESIVPGEGATVEVKIAGLKDTTNLTDLTPGRWTAEVDADGHYSFPALPAVAGMTARVMPYYDGEYVYESSNLTLTLVPNGNYTHDYQLVPSANDAPFVVSNNLNYSNEFPVDGQFELTFSKEMIPSSVGWTFSGTVTSIDAEWTNDNKTLTLTPSEILQMEVAYTLTITAGRSVDNVDIAAAIPFNFSTPDKIDLVETNLVVVEGDNYLYYPTNETITVRYNKEIDFTRTQSELQTQALSLQDAANNYIEIVITADGDVLTIDPVSELDDDADYVLNLKVWETTPASNAFNVQVINFKTISNDVLPSQVTGFAEYGINTYLPNTMWFEWNEVPEADYYRVYAKAHPEDANFILVQDNISGDVTEVSVNFDELGTTPFEDGETVTFNMTAVNSAGEGPVSTNLSINYDVPGTVTNLAQAELISYEVTYDSLALKWDAVGNADFYNIEGQYNGGAYVLLDQFLQSDADNDPDVNIVEHYVQLAALTTFDGTFEEAYTDSITFRVVAVNKREAGEYSNELMVMNQTPSAVTDAPVIWNIDEVNFNTLNLTVKLTHSEPSELPVSYAFIALKGTTTTTPAQWAANWNTASMLDTLTTVQAQDDGDSTYTVNLTELLDVDEDYLFDNNEALQIKAMSVNEAGSSTPTNASATIEDVVIPEVVGNIDFGTQSFDNSGGVNPVEITTIVYFNEPIKTGAGAVGTVTVANSNGGDVVAAPTISWNDAKTEMTLTFTVPAGEDCSGDDMTIADWKDTTGLVMDDVVVTLPPTP